MAQKVVKPKTTNYGVIQRGCSFLLPIVIKTDQDVPLDLTGYSAAFTVKRYQADFDRHDDYAFIQKDIVIQNPTGGSFFVQLSSQDTDFDPGEYYFDIELLHENGVVHRLCTMNFTLEGGPTNRHVNSGLGQLPTGDTISVITLTEGRPIVLITPTLSLDAEVYGQIATLMEAVQNLQDRFDELQESDVSQGKEITKLREDVDDIKEQLGI